MSGLRQPALVAYLAALALRILVALRTHALYPDGAVELTMARLLGSGRFGEALDLRFHPLYATLVAVVSAPFGLPVDETAIALAVGLSALVAPACAVAAGLLTPQAPRRAAFAAGLLAAAQPYLARLGGQVMAYSVAHACLALALLCVLLVVRRPERWRFAAGGGAAVGLGYVARADALTTGVGLGLALLLALGARRRREATTPLAKPLLAFGLAALLAVAPYLLALRAHTGEWMLSPKKSVASLVKVPGRTPTGETQPKPSASSTIQELIAAEAGGGERTDATPPRPGLARATTFALGKGLAAAHPLLVALALLGLLLRGGAPLPRGWGVCVLAMVTFLGAHVLLKANWGYTSKLHQSALGVLVVPLAARGLVLGTQRLARPADRRTALALGLSLAVSTLLPKALKPQLAHKAVGRHVSTFLNRSEVGSDGLSPIRVCGNGEARVAVHGAEYAEFMELPIAEPGASLERARRAGARFLIIYLRSRRPLPGRLVAELRRHGARPTIPPVRSVRDGITYTWLVFRL